MQPAYTTTEAVRFLKNPEYFKHIHDYYNKLPQTDRHGLVDDGFTNGVSYILIYNFN